MKRNLNDEKVMEAIKRMEMMGLKEKGMTDAIDAYQKGWYWYSDRVKMGSVLVGTLIEMTPEMIEKVKQFEKEKNCTVYHATHEVMEDSSEILDLFYVDDNTEGWEMCKNDILNGEQLVYSLCLNGSYYSEYGFIVFKTAFGGLVRTY